jgi:hypothetical protein
VASYYKTIKILPIQEKGDLTRFFYLNRENFRKNKENNLRTLDFIFLAQENERNSHGNNHNNRTPE